MPPFRITDVGVNSILLRADQDLLALAQELGIDAGRDELEGWIARGHAALQGLWSDTAGGYCSRDQLTGEVLAVATSASFLPLFAHAAPPERAAALGATWSAGPRGAFPRAQHRPGESVVRAPPLLAGPVWLIVNWMIADGLAAHGRADLADRLREDPWSWSDATASSSTSPHQRRRSGRRQLHLDRRHHAVLVAVAAMQR